MNFSFSIRFIYFRRLAYINQPRILWSSQEYFDYDEIRRICFSSFMVIQINFIL